MATTNHKEFLDIANGGEEMTSKQLKWGYWIVTHRVGLRKLGVSALIVFDALLCAYNIYHWADYFLIGYFEDQRMAFSLARGSSLAALRDTHTAAPLAIEGVASYASGAGKFDAVALISNPNRDWYVSFAYQFKAGGAVTEKANAFLLPGDHKPVGIYGISGDAGGSETTIALSAVVWKHISKHDIADVSSWLAKRNNFTVSDTSITPSGVLGTAASHLDFTVHNNTFFSYRNPEFLVSVYSGTTLLRVETVDIPQFQAGDARAIEIAVPASVPASATIQVAPNIDFFDDAVYLT